MAKRLVTMIHLILILALGSACAVFSEPEAEKPPLQVEWTMWDGDYTLVIAQEKGFFEKHGVQVEPQYYEVFSHAVPDLVSGKIDAGLFAVGDLLNASQRIGVKAVAVYDSGGSSTIVASPEIKSVADLRGRRVAVNIGTSGEIFVREMLRTAGLSVQDVELVNMDPEIIPEKLASEIQAGYVWEPYTSAALESGNQILFDSASSDVGALFPDLIVFRQQVLDERPEDVRAFLAAWFEALEYRTANPEESREIITKALGQDPGPGYTDISLYGRQDNLALFDLGSSANVKRSVFEILDAYSEFMISTGAVTRPPSASDVFSSSYLQ